MKEKKREKEKNEVKKAESEAHVFILRDTAEIEIRHGNEPIL